MITCFWILVVRYSDPHLNCPLITGVPPNSPNSSLKPLVDLTETSPAKDNIDAELEKVRNSRNTRFIRIQNIFWCSTYIDGVPHFSITLFSLMLQIWQLLAQNPKKGFWPFFHSYLEHESRYTGIV